MHLSTRGRYAVMAMLDLAELSKESARPVTLAMIAERQQISLSYLEQLFAKLRRGNVVDSVRGPGGGYQLPRPASEIWLNQIIDAVDEDIDVTRCGAMHELHGPKEGKGCVYGGKCNTHDLWSALSRHIEEFMKKISLQMVLNGDVSHLFTFMREDTEHHTRVHIQS